jgi:hypothetical protein
VKKKIKAVTKNGEGSTCETVIIPKAIMDNKGCEAFRYFPH